MANSWRFRVARHCVHAEVLEWFMLRDSAQLFIGVQVQPSTHSNGATGKSPNTTTQAFGPGKSSPNAAHSNSAISQAGSQKT